MSVNYPDSEWEIIDGVRYRKEAINPKKSTSVKTKESKSKKEQAKPEETSEPFIETEIEV